MNSSTRNPGNLLLITRTTAIAAIVSISAGLAMAAAKPKAVDVEIPYEAAQLKSPALKQPAYLQPAGGNLIVSDAAGGVYSVTMSGATKALADKTKVKHPAGLAEAPGGFGAYAGQVFVLNAPAGDKGDCEVDRIDKSGAVSTFAKLPDVGAKKPLDCRDLEFGPAGSAYAGKLFAAVSGNSTIYAIDSSGKAAAFGTFDKPLAFDLTAIAFAPSSDSKAPGKMLVGMRPRMTGAAKIGRITIVDPNGKMNDDPYLVGFINPTGFVYSPSSWGSYGNTFMIADMGKPAASGGAADGSVYRVYKGVARPFASNLADPTCMKFVGHKMVLADPSAKGPAAGAIVVISSML
ncbi:MAG TPA: hypothetical protein VMV27_05795 [Candidatus Binataceae bacterium]|nr:hypothetical protein [Candidatus Binataceae bacterium]